MAKTLEHEFAQYAEAHKWAIVGASIQLYEDLKNNRILKKVLQNTEPKETDDFMEDVIGRFSDYSDEVGNEDDFNNFYEVCWNKIKYEIVDDRYYEKEIRD